MTDDNPFLDAEWHLDEYGDLAWDDDMPSINVEQLALYLDCAESIAQIALDKLLELYADAVNWHKFQTAIEDVDIETAVELTLQDRGSGTQRKIHLS